MRYIFSVALGLLVCCAQQAQAAIELTSISVTAHTTGSGLEVKTAPISTTPITLSGLNQKFDSQVVSLFDIWTDESSVDGADKVAKAISVTLGFKYGAENFVGNIAGETYGVASFLIVVPFGAGFVDWNTPVFVDFAGGAGKLRIDFLDQLFNADLGYGDLNPGRSNGAKVKARITLKTDLPVPMPEVEPGDLNAPEPAAVLVWAGLGLACGVGGWRSRRLAA